MSLISNHLPKIYIMVLVLGPDNPGGNVADVNQFSCMDGDGMLTRSMMSCARDVIRRAVSRDVIVTSDRSAPER